METYNKRTYWCGVLLSSIMAKLGVYAIVRFMIPIFPDIYVDFSTWFVAIGLFGLIYFGIAALMQDDIKKNVCLLISFTLKLYSSWVFFH